MCTKWPCCSRVLTQYSLHQTNVRSGVLLIAASTEVEVGFCTRCEALPEDRTLEAFVAGVFGMDYELDAIMMFLRHQPRGFGRARG